MFELTSEQCKTFKAFLLNAGTVSLGLLVFGSIIKPEGFHLLSFFSGCIIYIIVLMGSLVLDLEIERKEGIKL